MVTDTVFVQQTANNLSIYSQYGAAILMSIISVVCVFVAARFASIRAITFHQENEKTILDEFKIEIKTQIERLSGNIKRVEEKSVNWQSLMTFSEKIEKSISRVHDKREEMQINVMACMSSINKGIQELSITLARKNRE